ncbi:MAG: hypothetical protein JJU28_19660 [Cyclobacteriaceae bacterium]|nr:hypothetical protein [Cyclobacteriaceae bacterium]
MNKLTILHTNNVLELFYTLYPFILSLRKEDLSKVNYVFFNNKKAKHISGENLLFTRIFKGRFNDTQFVNTTLENLNKNFNTVNFLDDNAGADSTHFEFIDQLDGYYKAKLLTNKNDYMRKMYGRQIFSDYYHKHFDVNDTKIKYRDPVKNEEQLLKLKIAFNLGYGMYPKPKQFSLTRNVGFLFSMLNNIQLMKPVFEYWHKHLITSLETEINYKSKEYKISARFRSENYPGSISYQRTLFQNIIKNDDAFFTGIISEKKYFNELSKTFGTLSPFGFGEVCVRDFEAIIYGSLLIKPDMSHMKTFPDIYIPYETYLPIKWDGSDLLDKVDNVLSQPKEYHQIIENSRKVYRDSLINIDNYFYKYFGHFLQ